MTHDMRWCTIVCCNMCWRNKSRHEWHMKMCHVEMLHRLIAPCCYRTRVIGSFHQWFHRLLHEVFNRVCWSMPASKGSVQRNASNNTNHRVEMVFAFRLSAMSCCPTESLHLWSVLPGQNSDSVSLRALWLRQDIFRMRWMTFHMSLLSEGCCRPLWTKLHTCTALSFCALGFCKLTMLRSFDGSPACAIVVL